MPLTKDLYIEEQGRP